MSKKQNMETGLLFAARFCSRVACLECSLAVISHEMPSRACMFGVLAGSYLTIAKQGNACLHGAVSVSEVLFPAYLFGSFRS